MRDFLRVLGIVGAEHIRGFPCPQIIFNPQAIFGKISWTGPM
jgi:hypothetical protein